MKLKPFVLLLPTNPHAFSLSLSLIIFHDNKQYAAGFTKRSHSTKDLMQTFDEDYVSQNNRENTQSVLNNRVSMPTHVLSRVRNDSNANGFLEYIVLSGP